MLVLAFAKEAKAEGKGDDLAGEKIDTMSPAYRQQRRPIHPGLRPPLSKEIYNILLLYLVYFFPDVRKMLPPLYLYDPPYNLISHLRDNRVAGRS